MRPNEIWMEDIFFHEKCQAIFRILGRKETSPWKVKKFIKKSGKWLLREWKFSCFYFSRSLITFQHFLLSILWLTCSGQSVFPAGQSLHRVWVCYLFSPTDMSKVALKCKKSKHGKDWGTDSGKLFPQYGNPAPCHSLHLQPSQTEAVVVWSGCQAAKHKTKQKSSYLHSVQIPNQQPFKPKNISRAINHTQLAATAGDHRLIKGSWKSNPKVNCDGKKTLFLILAWQEPSSSVGSVFWGQYRVFVPQGCALLTTKAFLSPAAKLDRAVTAPWAPCAPGSNLKPLCIQRRCLPSTEASSLVL